MPSEPLSDSVSKRTYVVIPAYNEAPRLLRVVQELSADYPNVVVVDDGSSDTTYDVACKVARHSLRHLLNRGQGAALQTGIEFALSCGAEFVVTYDADGQHRAQDVAALVAPIARGECDVTLGSRFLGEAIDMPTRRRLILGLGVLFTRLVNRVPVTDTHNGLRAFSRAAAERIQIRFDGMAHANEILDGVRRAKLRFVEVPVQIRYTEDSLAKGQSSLNAVRIAVQYLSNRLAR